MEISSFTSKDERPFHTCRFTKEDGTEITVYFFSQLGEQTSAEIKAKKHELYVGQWSLANTISMTKMSQPGKP